MTYHTKLHAKLAAPYEALAKYGEPRWTRTNDPQLKRLLLYRLS